MCGKALYLTPLENSVIAFVSAICPHVFTGEKKMKKKSRQNAENKQTFDFRGRMKLRGKKSSQNTENKQTFDLTGKNLKMKLRGKTRQNPENKQTFLFLLFIFFYPLFILDYHTGFKSRES